MMEKKEDEKISLKPKAMLSNVSLLNVGLTTRLNQPCIGSGTTYFTTQLPQGSHNGSTLKPYSISVTKF